MPDCEKQGDVRGFYALVLDVTDRNRAEHEARSLLDELAHANRISMMGELAATLAHGLDQPMTAIMSNAQAATRFLDVPAPTSMRCARSSGKLPRRTPGLAR